MNKYRYLLTAAAAFCLFSHAALAQETAPGDACTAAEENFTIYTGGPETTGNFKLLRCNGTIWQVLLAISPTGKIAIGANYTGGSPDTSNNIHLGHVSGEFTGGGGVNNIAIDPESGRRVFGSDNISIGRRSIYSARTVSNNVFIGSLIGSVLADGSNNNTIVGSLAGSTLSVGSNNILLGYDVETSAATASNELNIGNVIFGDLTGAASNGTGTAKVGINNNDPQYALDVTGDVNIPLDNTYRINDLPMFQLYPSATETVPSVAIVTGVTHTTLEAPNSFSTALIIGYGAGEDISGGSDKQHTLVGQYAGANITTQSRVTALGYGAARDSAGSDMVAIGHTAGFRSGAGTTYVGNGSGQFNTGLGNVAVGASTLVGVDGSSTGRGNVAIGNGSGNDITTGDYNIFIGQQAGETVNTGGRNIIIGYDIEPSAVGVSNELNIGGTVFGILTTDQVGIGTTSAATIDASAALEVVSTSRGFLPPRVANTAAVTTPAKGLMIYDSSADQLKYNTGTSGSPVWTTIGGATPAGADTQVQFNNSGALGASANFTWASDTLTVTGDILFTGITRDLSDARRKENITRITGALDKIGALNGVSFIMKDDPNRAVELGLIAHDVEKVFPELVITTTDGTMALNYQGMVGPLVEAVKELDAKNTELDAENTELRAALDALSSRMDALEGKPQSRSGSRSGGYRFNQ